MTSLREQVVAAFEADDQLAIRSPRMVGRMGSPCYVVCPRAREAVPYMKLLADEDPAAVLEALRELAGEWRPHPAAVRGHLHRAHDNEPRVSTGPLSRPCRHKCRARRDNRGAARRRAAMRVRWPFEHMANRLRWRTPLSDLLRTRASATPLRTRPRSRRPHDQA
jgi:hypothetical protein